MIKIVVNNDDSMLLEKINRNSNDVIEYTSTIADDKHLYIVLSNNNIKTQQSSDNAIYVNIDLNNYNNTLDLAKDIATQALLTYAIDTSLINNINNIKSIFNTAYKEIAIAILNADQITQRILIPSQPPSFICKGYLPLGKDTVNLLSGFGGRGKSWIALNTALEAATVDQAVVAYWTREESTSYLNYKLDVLLNQQLNEYNIDFFNRFQGCNLQRNIRKNLFLTNMNKTVKKIAKDLRYIDFLILDPILSFFEGNNENDNKQVRDYVSSLIDIAAQYETTILMIQHAAKNASNDIEFSTRGAGAWIDTSRVVYEIENIAKNADYDTQTSRKILLKKDNLGVFGLIKAAEKILYIKPTFNDFVNNNREANNEKQRY